MNAARWPAATLSRDWSKPIEGSVRAIMWPTINLARNERWFDELYVWTEGFQASTMQRARIQLAALHKAMALLEREQVQRVGVTLSFGTVERCLDLVTDAFDANRLHAHRVSVILRGSLERLRSPYRVQTFIEWLRGQQNPVGYRLSADRISMEMRTIDFVRPDFAKVTAPNSLRVEFWQDLALEARAAGLNNDWLIVAGIDTPQQKQLAARARFGFAQGHGVRSPYDPPASASSSEPVTLPRRRLADLILD